MRRSLVPILFAKPGWVLPGATLDMDFANNRAWRKGVGLILPGSILTTTRASNETTLLPSSAAGAAYLTFASNVPAIISGSGLQIYQAATNNLLNSTAPVTQTTPSLGTGTYTLWVNGTGSATSSAGSATGSGFGAASNGTPNTFTLTGAGTVTVTVAGSLNAFQLESGAFGTPFVVTAGAAATRAADAVTATLGSWFNASAGAYVSTFSTTVPNSGNAAVAGFDDGTTVNQMYPFTSGTALDYFMRAGGVVRYNQAAGVTLVNGATNKVAMAYGPTPDFGAINGANTQSLTQIGLPTGFNRLTLGFSAVGGDKQINGFIKRFTYIPTRPTNTQVTALTV